MIINELYNGSGIGNQLWTYVVTRVIAFKNNYEFSIMGKENYKGKDLIDLDFGIMLEEVPKNINYVKENLIRNKYGIDISKFDENIWNVKDNTIIDGGMQSVKYIENYKKEICKWLTPKKNKFYFDDNHCIIHFRGSDYIGAGKTLLTKKYYKDAISHMIEINKDMIFLVVTDDVNLARTYFNENWIIGSSLIDDDKYKASHHSGGSIDVDYMLINSAKNIILSNSTFGFWATWTNNNVKNVIAPKYWFAHNYSDGYWSTNDMIVKEWKYLDREGNISI